MQVVASTPAGRSVVQLHPALNPQQQQQYIRSRKEQGLVRYAGSTMTKMNL